MSKIGKKLQMNFGIGAIVPSESEPDKSISTAYIVQKPNGKFRPVINLRYCIRPN